MTYEEAEQECLRRDFDGLAVVTSPAEFRFLRDATVAPRKVCGLWVALRYDLDLNKLLWADGTEAARDTPWETNYVLPEQLEQGHHCGQLRISGLFGMIACDELRYAVCGYRPKRFQEARGETFKQTSMVSSDGSILSSFGARSYLECAISCTTIPLCRVSRYDADNWMCTLLGPGELTVHNNTPAIDTFYKQGYLL
ncbi:hypothetical protein EGW08_002406 [Elysia chlorotica]|uniref:C-type lectin domain-containing protein n=1 Tax=Elysia chlorotica TaxID=188477 RepID=A0A3S0ZYL1_ELYCH|nr:hypothetical protein EGW08_002406 [Elysia chlorotica]